MNRMDRHDQRLLNALTRLEDRCPAENPQLSLDENEKLAQMALARLGKAGKAKKACRFPALRRSLRAGLAAAAVVCLGTFTVCAGITLLPMAAEKIGFFESAPSREQAKDPGDAPRGEHDGRTSVAAFNTRVGQSVTDSGITMTLDNVSMDAAGMDLYFTVDAGQAEEEQLKAQADAHSEYMPRWYQMENGLEPGFDIRLNGRQVKVIDTGCTDSYKAEDGTFKLWTHLPLMSLPEGEEISMEIGIPDMLGRKGNWNFQLVLDGKSVRTDALLGKAGVYEQPRLPALEDGTPERSRDLDLAYLAFGPRAGVAVSRIDLLDFTLADGYTKASAASGSTLGQFKITDSTGRELFTANSGQTLLFDEEDGFEYLVENVTPPDPAATSITLTPMVLEEGSTGEKSCVTTEELKNGVRLPTGPESGYIVRNFAVEGSSIRYEMVPYGWSLGYCELIPRDEEVTYYYEEDGSAHVGLSSQVIDPATGTISCRHDYYAASPKELAGIEKWDYCFGSYTPDEEHSITIPLSRFEEK